MTEPAASTVGGIVLAVPTVTITGAILGMQVDALILGFFFSAVGILLLEPKGGTVKAAAWVAIATVLAALISPWVVLIGAAKEIPWLVGDVARLGAAALIAIATPTALPVAKAYAEKRWGNDGEGAQ